MKSLCMACLFAACISAASAQDAPTVAKPKVVGSSNVDQVFAAADEFMARQVDLWFDAGDFLVAAQLSGIRYAAYPSDYELLTNFGWMLENTSRGQQALELYMQFRKTYTEDPDRALAEATYYFIHKNFAPLPSLLEPVIDEACHANNFRMLARAYDRLGKLDDAIRVYEALVKRDPADQTAKANLEQLRKKKSG